jgi:acetolactate synthase-1/2/3 large subunit
MKLSDYIIDFLEKKGIKEIFTVSGGGCIHLIDSLGKSKNIKYICNHHEQASAMAAEGYSRINEHLGVALVTTGPGGINALNGVFGCWADSIPCLFLSGQVSLNQTIQNTKCRQIGDQEYPIIESVKPMTKYAVMITDKNTIRYHLERAYYEATNGRKGPVWIDIPLDLQGSDINPDQLESFIPAQINETIKISDIENILSLIKSASKPLIVVGGGVRSANAIDDLNKFLSITQIPVMTSCHSAIDTVNESYPYYVGRHGILGQRSSNQIIQECDLLLVLGSRLILKTTGYNLNSFAKNAKKVIIDIDQNEIDKHKFNIDIKVNTDIKKFLTSINKSIQKPEINEWREHCKNLRNQDRFVFDKHYNLKDKTSVYVFVEKLSKILPTNIPIVTSDGAAHVVTQQSIRLKENQRLFTNTGCASMGYGLPAAIGACLANNKKEVICIEGDGSIMMNLQELQTLKHYDLPIKLFIINNNGYFSIKQTQKLFFNGNEYASGPNNGVSIPSFEKLAYAFDIKYLSIKTNNQIDENIQKALSSSGPVLCEIFAHDNEAFEPKVVPKGIDNNGRIIPGELTDMFISENFS